MIKSKSKISFSTDKKNSINQRIPSLNNLSKEIKINKDDSLLKRFKLNNKILCQKTKTISLVFVGYVGAVNAVNVALERIWQIIE